MQVYLNHINLLLRSVTLIELNINGRTYKLKVNKDYTLLWVLREDLGLTGTKYGCGIGI